MTDAERDELERLHREYTTTMIDPTIWPCNFVLAVVHKIPSLLADSKRCAELEDILERLSSYVGNGLPSEQLPPADYEARISDGIDRIIRVEQNNVQDCGMMIRRLLRQCSNDELKAKALEFIKRKGLQGSVLRTKEADDDDNH